MIARRLLDQGNLKIARHDIVDPRNSLIEARLEQLLEMAERQALPSRPLLNYQHFFPSGSSIGAGVVLKIIAEVSAIRKCMELLARIVHTSGELYLLELHIQTQIARISLLTPPYVYLVRPMHSEASPRIGVLGSRKALQNFKIGMSEEAQPINRFELD
jgi:hypothetical protein